MTQEQRINRGTVIIFVLSIILVLCLCVTATLAYFAGTQDTNTTLIMGGPVRVSMVNKEYNETYGKGNLVMNIKPDRQELLPGIGIDMQAIAKLTSSAGNASAVKGIPATRTTSERITQKTFFITFFFIICTSN